MERPTERLDGSGARDKPLRACGSSVSSRAAWLQQQQKACRHGLEHTSEGSGMCAAMTPREQKAMSTVPASKVSVKQLQLSANDGICMRSSSG